MAKSATITVRVSPELKSETERVLKALGLSASEAITLFYSQIKLHKGIPFEIKIPNEITEKTFQKTDKGEGLIKCKDADDMFEKLGI
ncbi:MAG TPA: type II toxin-antitoxin system RelB/DinJ family antitoxin [Methanothermobacter sp.]|nr:type II toxin-antitoxin system RelB/DinJ family antitoxin [Methanothermobacter sp.]